jgi:transcriptional regulator with XRE-family HTH domain
MTSNFMGARIKALREERKLSQDDLARMFGFKDRQTVSAIETGERRVTAEELVLARLLYRPVSAHRRGTVLVAADGRGATKTERV